ncbi:MAG TPA: acetate--CoA ligase family protein [Syntrophorhabdaceae bacterium]|nr:acetate--CoA ligase family protein [Syntrophorhabdaceae bacterium]HQK46409.1 acetate--CoA ligase family protein [Syntrophorhabdaceae bacterium]HRR72575.1 acetate--CoA ligase family protein [Syntrophorhabdaceae bacterium]HRV22545.1 acetate--CoA ligase family protein [Syntrophorhabdaceae bacterium]
MNRESFIKYKALFRPDFIVIIGASSDLNKPGGKVLKNIINHGYKGKLMVVNPNSEKIMGISSYRTIKDLPEIPELAIIAVPAKAVLPVFEDIASSGIKTVKILSSGFGEKGEEGKRLEMELLDIANKNGITLIGPNCSGFMTPYYCGKFAGIIPEIRSGSIDLISGSGAFVDLVMEQAVNRGLSFSNVVNVGNSIQMGIEDLIALYEENYDEKSARILMLYIESLRKPLQFLNNTQNLIQKGCSIVAIKSGSTNAGLRAAISHTGAMANDDTFVDALFKKAGIIRVSSKMEMIDVACVLKATGGKLNGNRICVITDAGGPGVIITDELERQGFQVSILKEKTRARVSRILPSECSVLNPIDCFPSRTAGQIKEILQILNEEEQDTLDAIIVMIANPGFFDNRKIYNEVARAMEYSIIPILPVFSSITTCYDLLKEFASKGNFFFFDEVNLARALGKVLKKPKLYNQSEEKDLSYDKKSIEAILRNKKGLVPSIDTTKVLQILGFKLPKQIYTKTKEEVYSACKEIGFPLVMKVVGPVHKTDINGVRIGIDTYDKAISTWEEFMGIIGVEAVSIQEYVEGHEVIIGSKRNNDEGHLIMFGLGGIYTEALKDIVFNLPPLTKEEAYEMIKAIKGFSIIKGVRAKNGMSKDQLAEYLIKIGRFVMDFPCIEELDLNPIKGYGDKLYAVDARIIISN